MSVVVNVDPKVSRFPVAARRKVSASILTEMGWLRGDIVLPRLNSLVDYLNTIDGYLKVTNVQLTGMENPLRFLALSQDAYTLIVPRSEDDRLGSGRVQPEQKATFVSCIFASGWISGALETSRLIRVSDFLTAENRYFALKDCTFVSGGSRSRIPLAIVNGARLIGISEPAIEQARAGL